MKALLDTGLGGQFAHSVVFVGGALHVIHGGFFGAAEGWHDHLRQADILGPGNARRLILPEFGDAEMRTDAADACIAQNSAEFGPTVFGEASEAVLAVTYRRPQLTRLESALRKQLDGSGTV